MQSKFNRRSQYKLNIELNKKTSKYLPNVWTGKTTQYAYVCYCRQDDKIKMGSNPIWSMSKFTQCVLKTINSSLHHKSQMCKDAYYQLINVSKMRITKKGRSITLWQKELTDEKIRQLITIYAQMRLYASSNPICGSPFLSGPVVALHLVIFHHNRR